MTPDDVDSSIQIIEEYLANEGYFSSYDVDVHQSLDRFAAACQTTELKNAPTLVTTTTQAHNSHTMQENQPAAQQLRRKRVNKIIKNVPLKDRILARLDCEFRELDKEYQDASFISLGLISKVARLRELQQTNLELKSDSISIRVVVDTDWKGSRKHEKAWLPATASWDDFQELLHNMTYHAASTTRPTGLNSLNGTWMCRTFTAKGFIDKKAFPVRTANEHKALWKRMRSDKCGVLVCHSSTLEDISVKQRRKEDVERWNARVSERGQQWAAKNPLPEGLLATEEALSWEQLGPCPDESFFEI